MKTKNAEIPSIHSSARLAEKLKKLMQTHEHQLTTVDLKTEEQKKWAHVQTPSMDTVLSSAMADMEKTSLDLKKLWKNLLIIRHPQLESYSLTKGLSHRRQLMMQSQKENHWIAWQWMLSNPNTIWNTWQNQQQPQTSKRCYTSNNNGNSKWGNKGNNSSSGKGTAKELTTPDSNSNWDQVQHASTQQEQTQAINESTQAKVAKELDMENTPQSEVLELKEWQKQHNKWLQCIMWAAMGETNCYQGFLQSKFSMDHMWWSNWWPQPQAPMPIYNKV